MKKIKLTNAFILLSLGLLVGCNSEKEDFYEEAIGKGIEYFEAEEFAKATSYFEVALDEKENDEFAQLLLEQINSHRKAMKLYEEEQYEQALEQAKRTSEINQKSEKMIDKSDHLIKEIEELLTEKEMAAEQEVEIESETAEKTSTNSKKDVHTSDSETDVEEDSDEKTTETSYEYSDFIGYYLHFDSDNRAHADMITTIGNKYITIGWYASNFELYNVLDYSIEKNTLAIDYSTIPYGEENEEQDSFTIEILEENDETLLKFDSGMLFYKSSDEEVLDYDYLLKDYLIEDIEQ